MADKSVSRFDTQQLFFFYHQLLGADCVFQSFYSQQNRLFAED